MELIENRKPVDASFEKDTPQPGAAVGERRRRRALGAPDAALHWWEHDPNRAILDMEDPAQWAVGTITPPEFDTAWPGAGTARRQVVSLRPFAT
jgi:hypothetical protein